MASIDGWNAELSNRREKIYSIIEHEGADVGLIYSSREYPEPFRYLTNFIPTLGDMWGILTGPDHMICFLNFDWELREAAAISGLKDWFGLFDPLPKLIDQIKQTNPKKVAVLGMQRLPFQAYQELNDKLSGITFIDIGKQFHQLRRIKSPFEIQMIRKAITITDSVIKDLRQHLTTGMTEFEISARIQYLINQQGAVSAFSPLVLGGTDADTAVIARMPRERPLQKGDSLMIDIGASYQGYQSDIARTFVFGNPNKLQLSIWDTLRRVHERLITHARPGIPCNALHQVALEEIEASGHRLLHRIGHGIGLATSFEWPSMDIETELLQPGMTLAIEPAIYAEGAGAMKLEDNILITEKGVEVMSKSKQDLVILV